MNYYDVACDEHDQDRFLEWLMLLRNSSNDKQPSKSTISFFKGLLRLYGEEFEKIEYLNVNKQYTMKKDTKVVPDFVVSLRTDKKSYIILIEDKVGAYKDNDLKKYAALLVENKEKIEKNSKNNINNSQLLYYFIRTVIKNGEKERVQKDGFKYIDKEKLIEILKECEGEFPIKEMIEHLSINRNDDIETHQKKKLFKILKKEINCYGEYINSDMFFYLFGENKEPYLELEIKSKKRGELTFRIFSDIHYKNLYSEIFKIVKNSKTKPVKIGSYILTLKEPKLGELIDKVKELYEEARKILQDAEVRYIV